MYIDEDMINLIIFFRISFDMILVPGQFNHLRTKLSPFHQSVDPFLISFTKLFMNTVLSTHLSIQM
jgi:hypothetical protein